VRGRDPFELKKIILSLLKDGEPLSYSQLEKKVNTNWQTIRNTCKELEIYGFVNIEHKKIHPVNKNPYSRVVITVVGKEVLKRMKS